MILFNTGLICIPEIFYVKKYGGRWGRGYQLWYNLSRFLVH